MTATKSIQDNAVSILHKKGFNVNRIFSPTGAESDEVVLMSKRIPNGNLHAQVDPDGTVNGQSVEDYLQILNNLS